MKKNTICQDNDNLCNCKAYNIDPYKYLCDVFRRIKNTAKDQLVILVAHKWQSQVVPAIY